MGGLVIKKAFILARQIQDFESLARRVRTIFFLATPHRGSDLAQLLSKFLNFSSGARPFVTDLHRNSLATQAINDEFPHHCKDLQLYSFYETLATKYGVGKSLVVDKDLATLGYDNERTAYLNANHRDICKYTSPSDPNYLTVRNALASVIDNFRSHVTTSKRDLDSEQCRILDGFLGVSDAHEDDLMSLDGRRMKGSCEWILQREGFLRWRDSPDNQVYWISAKPGTGKSVLMGYIVKHLNGLDRNCAFYFFSYGNNLKSTIQSFLLSMARQIAYKYREVSETLLKIYEKDDQLSKMDYRTIWRKLFLDGSLRVKLCQPQYWVIDALDECQNGIELVSLLLKATETSNIRIFVSSRNRFETYRQLAHPIAKVISEEISAEDINFDILLYLKANIEHLPFVEDQAREKMVNQILKKSAGCFLWVTLIVQELRQVHTTAEIRQVLEEVPSDMSELYSRVLDSMSKASHGKLLAKAILTWTVCSARPLTTDELYHALRLDMKDTVDSVQKSIIASCGQLVYVDAQSRVQMIHQTARDFLCRSSVISEFSINRELGHTRLALACLQYLNGNEMKGPRHRKLSGSNIVKDRCPFIAYSCNWLFEHITCASSIDEDLLLALAKFFSSPNVLSWIEYLAQNSDLNRLIQTGKALRTYLHKKPKHLSPLSKEVAILDSWATDLVRLVTKFGKKLSISPSSIFHIIPPFCPAETAPRKQFAVSTRGIAVLGLSNTNWDDCLSTIVYRRGQATALACSLQHFAVGLSSGNIVIYNETTCQEVQSLQHYEPVKLLQFGEAGRVLASSGMGLVRIWDVRSWHQVSKFDISQQCLSLVFIDEDKMLLGALKNNKLMCWDLITDLLHDCRDWTHDIEGQRTNEFRRPTTAAFGIELNLLAVVYRGQDILLWDLARDTLYDTYGKEVGARSNRGRITNATVWNLVFSHDSALALLAAAYSDGDLVLFDTSEGIVKETIVANAQTLASSAEGRMLATGDSLGTIQLLDFETLKLLYRIRLEEYGLKSLAFSGNNRHLLDIRGSHCRVWDPMVLYHQNVNEQPTGFFLPSTASQTIKCDTDENLVLITALACHENGEIFFCGKEDGSVWLYETKTGLQSQKLCSHVEGLSVTSLFFDEKSQMLSSVDVSSWVKTHRLIHYKETWKTSEALLDHRFGVSVQQLLGNIGHTRLLVCSADFDTLYSITQSGSKPIHTIPRKRSAPYRWACHPLSQDQLILIISNRAHIYEWQTLKRLSSDDGILLEEAGLLIQYSTSCFKGMMLATAFAEPLGTQAKSKFLLWCATDFTLQSEKAVPVPRCQDLTDQIEFLIGAYEQRMVFLDSSGWVCSTDSDTFGVVQHFFIPADWLSTTCSLMIEVTSRGDVIFVKRDEVAVIKRGLDIYEPRSSSVLNKRALLDVPTHCQ